MTQAVAITCPGCGERLTLEMKKCPSCHGPVTISTFNSVYSMSPLDTNKYANAYRKALSENPNDKSLNISIALCYLKLNLYDKALPAFEKAIEDNFDNSEAFFYAAVCLLKGKKAFLQPRPIIDKIIEYIDAAIMIDPKGIYYYFLAYIKYDYFARKSYITSPNYEETLIMARQAGFTDLDTAQLFDILHIEKPACL